MHIPASVENIEGGEYNHGDKKYIKHGAFSLCESLRAVTFAEGSKLKNIGKYAFSECGKLKINLPEGIETIPERCFYKGEIEEIRIPASV